MHNHNNILYSKEVKLNFVVIYSFKQKMYIFFHTYYGVICMKKKRSITRCIRDDANEVLNKIEHDLTRNSYKNIVRRYIEYCRNEFSVKTLEECRGYIQVYCDSLDARGLSASTVHTYCAAICKVFGDIPMSLINKKKRYVAEYSKGRKKPVKKYRTGSDPEVTSTRLIEFQKMVGIRRHELARLTGKDVVERDGITYVYVRNGKGGKNSYIYITEENAPKVREYFAGKGLDEKIFEAHEFNNTLNLHWYRAMHAQEMYNYFENKIKIDPSFRKTLEELVVKYWVESNLDKNTHKPKPFNYSTIRGKYVLRGKNRAFAKAHNKRWVYDKLVLKSVSVLCLAHYRLSVMPIYMNYI